MNKYYIILVLSIILLVNCREKQQKILKTSTDSITTSKANANDFQNDRLIVKTSLDTIIPKHFLEYLKSKYPEYSLSRIEFDTTMTHFLIKDTIAPLKFIAKDFNGDSIPDFAAFVNNGKGIIKLIMIYSNASNFLDTFLADSVPAKNNVLNSYLQFQNSGKIQGFPFDNVPDSETVATLDFPGVHLFYYEQSSVLFYWKKDHFKELWTSD